MPGGRPSVRHIAENGKWKIHLNVSINPQIHALQICSANRTIHSYMSLIKLQTPHQINATRLYHEFVVVHSGENSIQIYPVEISFSNSICENPTDFEVKMSLAQKTRLQSQAGTTNIMQENVQHFINYLVGKLEKMPGHLLALNLLQIKLVNRVVRDFLTT